MQLKHTVHCAGGLHIGGKSRNPGIHSITNCRHLGYLQTQLSYNEQGIPVLIYGQKEEYENHFDESMMKRKSKNI